MVGGLLTKSALPWNKLIQLHFQKRVTVLVTLFFIPGVPSNVSGPRKPPQIMAGWTSWAAPANYRQKAVRDAGDIVLFSGASAPQAPVRGVSKA